MKDVPNEMIWRPGDPPPPGNTRDRFGNTARLYSAPALGQLSAQAFVSTSTYENPIPWAIQIRFSTDGVRWFSRIPAGVGCDIRFNFSSGFDQLGGRALETMQLETLELPTVCMIIASQLEVTATAVPHVPDAGPTTDGNVWVKVVAAPLNSIACNEILGEADNVSGYDDFANSNFFPDPSSAVEALAPNPNRKQFILNNRTNMNVTVKFGDLPLVVGGEATFVMEPGWVYESPTTGLYKGRVVVRSEEGDDTPDGFFLAGEGI